MTVLKHMLDAAPAPGQIRNANGPLLVAALRRDGIAARYLGIAPDTEEGLRERLERGFECDALLVSGAVSMGDYDLVPATLEAAGARTLFHGVNVKPGRPFLFAKKDDCLIFGLPGNPVSNLVGYRVFIQPALMRMQGAAASPRFEKGVLATRFKKRSGRKQIYPCRVRREE